MFVGYSNDQINRAGPGWSEDNRRSMSVGIISYWYDVPPKVAVTDKESLSGSETGMVKVTGDPWITPVGGVTVGITGGVLAVQQLR